VKKVPPEIENEKLEGWILDDNEADEEVFRGNLLEYFAMKAASYLCVC
jgi:hypothetical protein